MVPGIGKQIGANGKNGNTIGTSGTNVTNQWYHWENPEHTQSLTLTTVETVLRESGRVRQVVSDGRGSRFSVKHADTQNETVSLKTIETFH